MILAWKAREKFLWVGISPDYPTFYSVMMPWMRWVAVLAAGLLAGPLFQLPECFKPSHPSQVELDERVLSSPSWLQLSQVSTDQNHHLLKSASCQFWDPTLLALVLWSCMAWTDESKLMCIPALLNGVCLPSAIEAVLYLNAQEVIVLVMWLPNCPQSNRPMLEGMI